MFIHVAETPNRILGSCGIDANSTGLTCAFRRSCGDCGVECAAGQTCCNGVCADLTSDMANCGACGFKCANIPNVQNAFCKNSAPFLLSSYSASYAKRPLAQVRHGAGLACLL